MSRPSASRGFTLVEMLVALVVFALLSAATVGLLAYTADQQAAVRARIERVAELQLAGNLLRADLSQVAVRRVRGVDGTPERAAFVASPHDSRHPLLAFSRRGWSNPDAAPRPALQYVEYRIVDDRLERRARQHPDGAEAGAPQVLLQGLHNARIAFHSHAQWSDGWAGGTTDLPDAVRLEFELDGIGPVRQLFLLPGTGA